MGKVITYWLLGENCHQEANICIKEEDLDYGDHIATDTIDGEVDDGEIRGSHLSKI